MAISYTIGAWQIWSNTVHSGLFPVLMIIANLAGFPPCVCAIELWVDSLPSQVLPWDSLETRVKRLADKRHLFVWVGAFGTAAMSAVGGTGLAFFKASAVLRLMYALSAIYAATTAVCIGILGVRIKRVIDLAEAKARLGSKAFYRMARRNLRWQMVALCGTCAAFSTMEVVNELWNRAEHTPLITSMVLTMIATLAFTLAVHFSRPNRVSNRASPQASSVLASSGALATRQVPGGRTSTTMWTAGIAPTPTRLVTVNPYGRSRACTGGFTPSNTSACSGGSKVVPTVGDDPA
ncbi:unnamed protein product [Ectocarpus sp. 12 AP-2014]